MTQMISLNSVQKDSVELFAKLMVYLSYMRAEGDLPKTALKSVSNIKNGMLPFLTKFKIKPLLISKITASMIAGEPDGDRVQDLQAILKAKKDLMNHETDIDTHLFKLIFDCSSFITRGTESTLVRISKAVSHFHDPNMSRMFITEVEDQGSIELELRKLVKKMVKRVGLEISAEERKHLKDTKLDLLKQYTKLRKELNSVPKDFISAFIRQSSEPLVQVHKVILALKKAKIKHHSIPAGYNGFIDDHLAYYTVEKLKLNGTPSGEVLMNPSYDPKKDDSYVCLAKAATAKDYSRLYTISHKSSKTKKKFGAVGELADSVSKIRSKWLSDLRGGYEDKSALLAMCCELVYVTSARVGSSSANTGGEKTYGLTTLLVGQYKKKGSSRILEYRGKKNQLQKHLIPSTPLSSKTLIEYLDALALGKKRVDTLITFKGKKITGKSINDYLRSIGVPTGVTIHKFRTLRGTVLAKNLIAKSPFKNRTKQPTQKQVNDWLKKNLELVAKELGHFSNGKLTVNTAIQNYIDPSVLEEFYQDAGVRALPIIERSINLAKGNV
jgi:DNA topoisomerase IB